MIGIAKNTQKVYKDHLYAGAVNGCLIIPAFLIRNAMHYANKPIGQATQHRLHFTEVKSNKQARFADIRLFAHSKPLSAYKEQGLKRLLLESKQATDHLGLSLTPFDLSVLGAITSLFVAHQLQKAVVTTLQLIELLGLEPTGDNYQRVREAITTLGNIGFHTTESGFLPEDRLCWVQETEDINGHSIQLSRNYQTLLNRSASAIIRADQLIALRRSRNTAAQLLFLFFASSESSVIQYKVSTLAKRFGYALPYGEKAMTSALALLSALKFLTRSIIEKVRSKGWSLEKQPDQTTFKKHHKVDTKISYRDAWNYASRFYVPWHSHLRAFRDLHPRKTALVVT